MSIAMPAQDIAPSVPTRLVTLDFGTMWKGRDGKGSVTFTLPGDLRIPADDVFLKAGAWEIELDADGKGSIPLPTYDPDAMADGVGNEWYILVSKSWSKQVDMIRVPTGSGPISLAKINPIVDVTPAMGQWLITNAAVEFVEGAQWGVTVVVTGGIARFRFTFPPGGTAWDKTAAVLSTSTNMGSLTPGIYRVGNGTVATALGLPLKDVSAVTVVAMSSAVGNQSAVLEQWGFDGKGGVATFRAWRSSTGVIGPWIELGKVQTRILAQSENGARLGDGMFGVLADRFVQTMPKGASGRLTEGVVGDTTWAQMFQQWTTAGSIDLLMRSMSTTFQQTWQRPESPRAVEHSRREEAAMRAELTEVRADGSVPSSAFTAAAAPIPMLVPTPDGTGQATHPSIIDMGAGNAWNGHRFWMAYTPYAFADDSLEDPVVAWSDNGNSWTSAGAASFPLDDAPGGTDFNSDTNAVLHNGTLYVFWRRSDANGTKIWMRSSTNGTTWAARVLVWDPASMSAFSPSIVKTSTGWRLWFVGGAANARRLGYVDSTWNTPTGGFGGAANVTWATTPLPPGREPWHVEVHLFGGRWWGLLTDTTVGLNGVDCEVRLMQSADGINWDVAATQLIPKLGHSHDSLYKATMALTGTALKPTIALWYSGLSADKGWWLYRAGTVMLHEPKAPATKLARASEVYLGNLNALFTPGVYRTDYSTQQTAALNYPAGPGSCIVEVRDWYISPQSVIQVATYEDPATGVWQRRSLNGVWGPWVKRPTRAEVTALEAATRDTGWRNITALIPALTAGGVRVRRVGSAVYLSMEAMVFGTQAGGEVTIDPFIPLGFRSSRWRSFVTAPVYGPAIGFRTHTAGRVQLFGLTAGAALRGDFTFLSDDPWPTTLPGTPE